MELLVVISIIGILSTVVLGRLNTAREKAQIAKAKLTISQLNTAISRLAWDSGFWPGREAAAGTPDPQPIDTVRCDGGNNEVQNLNDPQAGIVANDGSYPNWDGPYFKEVPLDPWGHPYFFDTDYDQSPVGDGQWAAVIGSYGPDGIGNNLYNADDIIKIVAEAPCP